MAKAAAEELVAGLDVPPHRWTQLEQSRASYVKLVQQLGDLCRHRRVPALLPFGPRALLPGALKHTNEVLVLLGDGIFASVSAEHATSVARRRIEVLDRKLAAVAVGDEQLETFSAQSQPSKRDSSVSAPSPQRRVRFATPESVSSSSVRPRKQEANRDRVAAPTATAQAGAPVDGNERATLMRRLAAGVQSAAQEQSNGGMIFLEEEFKKADDAVPSEVRGLPERWSGTDEIEDNESDVELDDDDDDESGLPTRSLNEELELLAQLQLAEENLENKSGEDGLDEGNNDAFSGLRRGFLFRRKQRKSQNQEEVESQRNAAFAAPAIYARAPESSDDTDEEDRDVHFDETQTEVIPQLPAPSTSTRQQDDPPTPHPKARLRKGAGLPTLDAFDEARTEFLPSASTPSGAPTNPTQDAAMSFDGRRSRTASATNSVRSTERRARLAASPSASSQAYTGLSWEAPGEARDSLSERSSSQADDNEVAETSTGDRPRSLFRQRMEARRREET